MNRITENLVLNDTVVKTIFSIETLVTLTSVYFEKLP